MTSRVSGRLIPAQAVLVLSAAALASLDLLVKAAVVLNMGDGRIADFGLFNLRLAFNTGVAFGLGASLPPGIVTAATAVLVIVLALFVIRSAPRLSAVARSGGALLLGGAAGNLVDRADGAGVVDYLHTGWFPTFNFADVFVVCGAGLLVLGSTRSPAPPREGA